jgi:hypothetical protein
LLADETLFEINDPVSKDLTGEVTDLQLYLHLFCCTKHYHIGKQNTTNSTSTSYNLTQVASHIVLTQSDFGELTDNLNSAREALRQ